MKRAFAIFILFCTVSACWGMEDLERIMSIGDDEKEALTHSRPESPTNQHNSIALDHATGHGHQALTLRNFGEENDISCFCRAFPYISSAGFMIAGMFIGATYLAHECVCLQ